MDFLKDIVKEIGGEYTQLAADIDETEKYVDTGSYIFNALVSGSIFGGVSGNKITAIAGESSTGKTFFSLAVVKNFLDTNPDGYCLYFDTEAAITKSLVESRGIDTSRLVVVNVVTIEEFRGKALKAVDLYLKKPVDEWDGILLTDISMVEQKVTAGNLSQLSKLKEGWIHCMIIPSNMNDNELEAFERRKNC